MVPDSHCIKAFLLSGGSNPLPNIANEALIRHSIHIDQNEFKNIVCFGNCNEVLSNDNFVN